MNNEYIIAVDENGSPYIAHAKRWHGYKSGQLLKPRESFFYYKKVELPNGKMRYFYSSKAYEAYLKNQSKQKKSKKASKKSTETSKYAGKLKLAPKGLYN